MRKPAVNPPNNTHHIARYLTQTYTGLASIANLLSNHKVQLLEQNKVHFVNNNRVGISTNERARERGREKRNLKRQIKKERQT